MTIHKLKSIKILGVDTDEYVGSDGTIFYDDETIECDLYIEFDYLFNLSCTSEQNECQIINNQ
jgi:hypothetical protein